MTKSDNNAQYLTRVHRRLDEFEEELRAHYFAGPSNHAYSEPGGHVLALCGASRGPGKARSPQTRSREISAFPAF